MLRNSEEGSFRDGLPIKLSDSQGRELSLCVQIFIKSLLDESLPKPMVSPALVFESSSHESVSKLKTEWTPNHHRAKVTPLIERGAYDE
jgi:hypothetical protein